MGFFQFFDKRVGVVSWYGQNTNIFAHLLHLDNVRLLYFLQNHIFRLKSSEKYWKSNCLLQVNFENRNRVNWHQLMFYIKWWVFVIIKMPCFHIYNIFKCHFKPNQKCQRDMKHPVGWHPDKLIQLRMFLRRGGQFLSKGLLFSDVTLQVNSPRWTGKICRYLLASPLQFEPIRIRVNQGSLSWNF